MTALAMILGMLPMALALGEGGEQNAPLGRAVIGGLLVATVVTLLVVPIVYVDPAPEAADRARARRAVQAESQGAVAGARDRGGGGRGAGRRSDTVRRVGLAFLAGDLLAALLAALLFWRHHRRWSRDAAERQREVDRGPRVSSRACRPRPRRAR